MLEALPPPAPDRLMILMGMFRDDPRPGKIDLGIGVYRDSEGRTPVFRSVREAERRIAEAEEPRAYLGFTGDPAVVETVAERVLGPERAARATGCQTTGGTGALFALGRLAALARVGARVWLPDPTWINHASLLTAAGLTCETYPWLDAAGRELDFEAALAALDQVPAGDLVVLHACCHNPSGADPDAAGWARIAEAAAARGWIPFFDVAYPGLGRGWDEDLEGLRIVADAAPETLLAVSGSKSFGLYRDRAGVALALTPSAEARRATLQALAVVNRNSVSFPPWRPGEVMRRILADDALAADWAAELGEMRARIAGNRRALAEALARRPGGQGWTFLDDQRGMFSLLGLDEDQVTRLREEHAIYVMPRGRINVAGLAASETERFAEALLAVV
jgi:aspartate/tyrosine/aromatic aminotransferase